jgi:hypothetical protein
MGKAFSTKRSATFVNAELIGIALGRGSLLPRGRACHKNDQCFVVQNNGSVVQHLVGYDRFEGEKVDHNDSISHQLFR